MNQPDLEIPPRSRAEERAILAVTCLAAFLSFNSFGGIGVALPRSKNNQRAAALA